MVDQLRLQTTLLELLGQRNLDHRVGRGRHFLAEALRDRCPPQDQPTSRQIMAAIWSLVAQGLAYLDFSQSAVENWELHLTDAGAGALADVGLNPDNPQAFLAQLAQRVPATSPTVLLYLREALATYAHRCYLASAVMLGVASEAAFLEMAEAFCTWLPATEQARYRATLDNPRSSYDIKFREFRARLEPRRGQLPLDLSDNLALTFDAVLDAGRR